MDTAIFLALQIRAVAMYNFMHNKYDDLVDAGVHMMTIFADDGWG